MWLLEFRNTCIPLYQSNPRPGVYKFRTPVAWATKSFMGVLNVYGSSVGNLLHSTHLATRILMWLLEFWKTCTPLSHSNPRTGVHKFWTPVAWATKFYMGVLNVYGSSVGNLLHSTHLTTRILMWLLEFWNTCIPLYQSNPRPGVHKFRTPVAWATKFFMGCLMFMGPQWGICFIPPIWLQKF